MAASLTRWTSSLRRVFVTAAVVWAALLFLAPYAATRSSSGQFWYAVAFSVYGIGQWICHQLPERSFYLWTAQLPVCARCTGIYLGGAVAAVFATVWRRQPVAAEPERRQKTRRPSAGRARSQPRRKKPRWPTSVTEGIDVLGLDARLSRWVLAVAAVPTALTLLYEWTTGDRPSNMIRALSGLPLGAAVVLIVAGALAVAVPPVLVVTPAMAARKVN